MITSQLNFMLMWRRRIIAMAEDRTDWVSCKNLCYLCENLWCYEKLSLFYYFALFYHLRSLLLRLLCSL